MELGLGIWSAMPRPRLPNDVGLLATLAGRRSALGAENELEIDLCKKRSLRTPPAASTTLLYPFSLRLQHGQANCHRTYEHMQLLFALPDILCNFA